MYQYDGNFCPAVLAWSKSHGSGNPEGNSPTFITPFGGRKREFLRELAKEAKSLGIRTSQDKLLQGAMKFLKRTD